MSTVKESDFKVVLIDYDEDLFTPLDEVGTLLAQHGLQWIVGRERTPEAALTIARDGDVVMLQSLSPILDREFIYQLRQCKCIVRLGIGYDNVDVAAATERGILVCNVPSYCIEDVAQHALALLLDSVRHVARQDRWIRERRWDRTGSQPTRRLRGCTLGLIGFGRIARLLVQQVQGFGITIVAYDPYLDAETIRREGARKVNLDELLQRADCISVHCPLTDETYHLLSTEEFRLVKDCAFLVNTSRGPIIDENALVVALRKGRLCGAGLDVFEQEPLPHDSPLRQFDNVTYTPHVAVSSEDSVVELYSTGAQIAVDIFHGRWPETVVNPSVAEVTGRVIQRPKGHF